QTLHNPSPWMASLSAPPTIGFKAWPGLLTRAPRPRERRRLKLTASKPASSADTALVGAALAGCTRCLWPQRELRRQLGGAWTFRKAKSRSLGVFRPKRALGSEETEELAERQEGADEGALAGGRWRMSWSIVRFIVPTYVLVVTGMVLTALDKSFVGRTSSLQLAALGPASAVFDCSSYVLTFVNTATLSLLADGSLTKEELDRIRSHSLVFAVFFGILQGAFLFCTAVPAVGLLGARGALLPFSVLYLQIR
ncbi:unnamed protein product, partial [Polarella glacialis]